MDKLKISGLFLKHTLAYLGEVIKKSASLPIIENVKLEYDDNHAVITATDLNITLKITLECVTSDKGVCLLDFKKLQENEIQEFFQKI